MFINKLSGEELSDGKYVLGFRPTTEQDGLPLFVIYVNDANILFQGNEKAKEVHYQSILFIMNSGAWCTLKQVDNHANLAKYLIVPYSAKSDKKSTFMTLVNRFRY